MSKSTKQKMTKTVLAEKLTQVQDSHYTKRSILLDKYVKDNALNKVGDILTDAYGKIKVETVSYKVNSVAFQAAPAIVYIGVALTAKGLPRKNSKHRQIMEDDLLPR